VRIHDNSKYKRKHQVSFPGLGRVSTLLGDDADPFSFGRDSSARLLSQQ
jgi:hypothetical protein